MADRLCAIYMLGDSSYIELLVGSKSLNDFLDRLEMIRLMITYDNQVFDRITELRDAIEEKKEELIQQEIFIRETKAEIIKQKSEIEAQKQERLQLMAKLKEEEKRYGEELDRLEQESKKIESDIRRLIREKEIRRQQEEQRREEERKAREEEQKSKGEQQPKEEAKPDKGSGQQDQGRGDQKPQGVMTWPAPGYRHISSNFGYRIHPITGVRKLHSGMDISGGGINGKDAVAAAAGEVIISGYNSGYGNYVVIDHGGGITTLYAHGSKRLVEVGQNVSAGQAVIKIGSTGVSTGPHLHFEVRKNGTPVNPKPYLGI
ncbi:MAG: peptidoglycan DD-metalloendopeptidase family protein [Clostridiales bacterium]|nr:peptidoglycan DD-metalloendopeptidase family protein [Clostridiales bacterium]